MKILRCFIFILVTFQFIYSQESARKSYSFSTIKTQPKIIFGVVLDSVNTSISNNTTFSFSQLNQTNYIFNVKELNENLFSNLNLFDNNYKDYTNYFMRCGYLEDGISVEINNPGDVMLSNIIDSFVNNYLVTNLFFKN
tara:strand:- start:205 stop:621 length:417 start_codon:yes stop_codon:yes gene_type:complete